ncbi:hypothetical protein SADUNF_Sadunf03G0030100 [Salix dunnii]|uniref:Uncharacterized protein n=1 Tax=Salix dunnii TaxID=1413687 RepID=A0A835K6S6_9ROSI|nr:hypothetical protein SADUNF_Sadunf03G0030100 [Salix dunnii]
MDSQNPRSSPVTLGHSASPIRMSDCPGLTDALNVETLATSPTGISECILPIIGREGPIQRDDPTIIMVRLYFVRVLIELDLSQLSTDLLCHIHISFPDGSSIKQRLLYEFLPKFCDLCLMPGHFAAASLSRTGLEATLPEDAIKLDPPAFPLQKEKKGYHA